MARIIETAFCEICGQNVPYSISEAEEDITVRGIAFSCKTKFAVCDKCGSFVYIPEINDENVDARNKAWQEAYARSIPHDFRTPAMKKNDENAYKYFLYKLRRELENTP